jgi:hypothetical protein
MNYPWVKRNVKTGSALLRGWERLPLPHFFRISAEFSSVSGVLSLCLYLFALPWVNGYFAI